MSAFVSPLVHLEFFFFYVLIAFLPSLSPVPTTRRFTTNSRGAHLRGSNLPSSPHSMAAPRRASPFNRFPAVNAAVVSPRRLLDWSFFLRLRFFCPSFVVHSYAFCEYSWSRIESIFRLFLPFFFCVQKLAVVAAVRGAGPSVLYRRKGAKTNSDFAS